MIPISKPTLTAEDAQAAADVVASGWLTQGAKVAAFEKAWCDFTGGEHSVATTSCTTGLHLALSALLGQRRMGAVVVPSFTWIASANAVLHAGKTPFLCDIDPTTYNICVKSMMQVCREREAIAVMPVHLFGLPADMAAIAGHLDNDGRFVVEDAACGFGARIDGRHVGTFGDAGVFSFHPRKVITTGEGGMVIFEGADDAAKARSLRDHGANISDAARHGSPQPWRLPGFDMGGFNYRMTDIQAAVGLSQMTRAEAIAADRQRTAGLYDDHLFPLAGVLNLPVVPDGMTHGWQSYVVSLGEQSRSMPFGAVREVRDAIMREMHERGVSCRPGTHAVHTLGGFRRHYDEGDLPNAAWAASATISLPIYGGMDQFTVATVADVLWQSLDAVGWTG